MTATLNQPIKKTQATIIFAKDVLHDRVIHIDDVDRSKHLEFVCLGCNEKLIPVKTEERGKSWHFRHPNYVDIEICRSRALHDFAVQVLMDNSAIVIGDNRRIEYLPTSKEASINGLYRSDVAARFGNEDLHFEVFVTHDLGSEKIKYYNDEKIKCVRIDLSDKKLLTASPEVITNAVLEGIKNKRIVYWNDKPAVENVESDKRWIKWLVAVGVAVAIFLLGKLLKIAFPKRTITKSRRTSLKKNS